MSEKYNDDYKNSIKGLLLWTVIGILYSTFLKKYGDDEEGVGPCFFFIYVIFAAVAIDWIGTKVKNLYHKIKNRFSS